MIKESFNLLLIFGFVLPSGFAFAQPGQDQWPQNNSNFSARNNSYRQPIASGWQSNFVSPNYNPYVTQTQNRPSFPQHFGTNINYSASPYAIMNPGYFPSAMSQAMPFYGSPYTTIFPLPLAPSMMSYTPWFPAYGATPLMPSPVMAFPGWAY